MTVVPREDLNKFVPIKKPPPREVAIVVLLWVVQVGVVRKREVCDLSLYPRTVAEFDLSKPGTLVKRYRNGIIHARGSRPLTDDLQGKSKPFPTKKGLQDLEPGWAIENASELVSELCETLGELKPGYFK